MSVSLFSITPVPEKENSQEMEPAYVAVPATASGTDVPSIRPDAVPTTEILPPHVAEKLPAIELEVALDTCHWKLLQEPAEGTAIDVHVPAYEPVPGEGAGAGAGAGAAGVPGAVGRRSSDLLSSEHAVEQVEAAARAASSNRVLFMARCR